MEIILLCGHLLEVYGLDGRLRYDKTGNKNVQLVLQHYCNSDVKCLTT